MEKGWVNIYATSDEYLASIAKELLDENEIETVVLNHKDTAYAFMGEVELYVREENEEPAKTILLQLNKG